MTGRTYTVAIVGATGVVGGTVRTILEQRGFPVGELRLLASARSRGAQLDFGGAPHTVAELSPGAFAGVDVAFFAAGGAVSQTYAPLAVAAGAVAIDKSSAFRGDPAVPLVVPEVNAADLAWHEGIIATPNCSTIQLVVALKPLHDAAGVERVVVSTYQSVSGSGKRGVDDLDAPARAWAAGDGAELGFYPRPIAFNLLPHIDAFLPDGSTKEEQKMVDETVKIFGDPGIRVTATCVRVPVFGAHSEAVNLQTRKPLGAAAARALLAAAPGVEVIDDPGRGLYPTPLDAEGDDPVYVGRIRDDDTAPNCVNFWVVADNLRKGAALNAVQIAEALIERGQL
jgi:aspartate-semialdehyde dehydrogenase